MLLSPFDTVSFFYYTNSFTCYSLLHLCQTRYNPILRLHSDVNDSIEVHDNENYPRGGNSRTSTHLITSTLLHASTSSVLLCIMCICYFILFQIMCHLTEHQLQLSFVQCFAFDFVVISHTSLFDAHRVGLRGFVEQTTSSQSRGGAHLSEMIQGYEQKGGAYSRPLGRLTHLLMKGFVLET